MSTVFHVITSTDPPGGAENMLYKLGLYEKSSNLEHVFFSLKYKGDFGQKFLDAGLQIYFLDLQKKPIRGILKFILLTWKLKPNIIQGWMYHANVFCFIAKPFFPKVRIIFNIRHSLSKLSYEKVATRLIIKINALLSCLVKKVINNSLNSIKQHEKIGFSKKNSTYIANGFDTNMFQPSSREYFAFRKKLSFTKETKIIGNIARFHPMKNHEGFLDACKKIQSLYNADVKFVLAGKGVDSNKKLQKKAKDLDIIKHCVFLGSVNSVKILPAFDIYVSSSLWGEGFPNVIGEAMACGVPCVATDVGDCQSIVDRFGYIASPGDTDMLANYCVQLLENPNHSKEEIRQHIIENYSIGKIVSQYEALYKKLMEK